MPWRSSARRKRAITASFGPGGAARSGSGATRGRRTADPRPASAQSSRIVPAAGAEAEVRALHVAVDQRRRSLAERTHERRRIVEQRGDGVADRGARAEKRRPALADRACGTGLSSPRACFERRGAAGGTAGSGARVVSEADVVGPAPPRRRAVAARCVARTTACCSAVIEVVAIRERATTPTSRIRSTPSRTVARGRDDGVVDRGRGGARARLVPTTRARAVRSRPTTASASRRRRGGAWRRTGRRRSSGVRSPRRSCPVVVERFARAGGSEEVVDRRRSSHARSLSRAVPAGCPTAASGCRRGRATRARSSTGSRSRAGCRPRPTGARARARSRRRRRARGCRRAPSRSARGARPAACCRGCCRRPARPSAWPMPDRHEVADDRERGGRHVEQLGQAHPDRRVARALRTGQLPERAADGEPLLEPVADRVVRARCWCARGGQSSGGGTSGRCAHCPSSGSGRAPSAPSTVSTSVSPTCAITRAWLMWCPRTTSSASSSSTDGGDAYERYCAVAHTHGRPVTCSITSIAAPSPQPPNNAPAPDVSPGTIGIRHFAGSSVGSSPKNVSASTAGGRYRTPPPIRTGVSIRRSLRAVTRRQFDALRFSGRGRRGARRGRRAG